VYIRLADDDVAGAGAGVAGGVAGAGGQAETTGVLRAVQPPCMNACFSSITMMSIVLQPVVQRPVQIVSTITFMPAAMMVSVNVAATHAGGPMQGAMLSLLAAMHW